MASVRKRKNQRIRNVLVAVTLALGGVEERLHRLTRAGIEDLVWDAPLDVLWLREDAPEQPHFVNQAEKLNRARDVFLAGPYDALLSVEADMVIPAYALLRLAQVDADVAYGLYCSRRAGYRWLAMSELSGDAGVSLSDSDAAGRAWGQVVATKGVGLGCTLIRRSVLEQVSFRWVEGGQACDWYFAQDVEAAGLRQAHDCGVVCGHVLSREPLQVLWPASEAPWFRLQEEGRLYPAAASAGWYQAVSAITFVRTGREVQAGERVELSAEQAEMLLRQGVVVPVTQGE